jgi:hypothetical protein
VFRLLYAPKQAIDRSRGLVSATQLGEVIGRLFGSPVLAVLGTDVLVVLGAVVARQYVRSSSDLAEPDSSDEEAETAAPGEDGDSRPGEVDAMPGAENRT